MDYARNCDHCQVQIHCRNLYVAMKILQEELRFAERDDLMRAFHKLKQDMSTAGYNFPDGTSFCEAAHDGTEARAWLSRAEAILREVRRTVSISPA